MGNVMVETLSKMSTTAKEILPDILVMDFTIVTACLVGKKDAPWALVDTGLENSAEFIVECAEKRFGKRKKPEAIILTHGHFDHVGSVLSLAAHWDVPVYIHELELPYVTGKKDYPLPDPTVDEGLVAKMSPTFPHTAIDLGDKVSALPADGSVPGMREWRWIFTPGHAEGHVSLFRERDRTLLAGDAFTTTKQESLKSVLTHAENVEGPPKYLTTDWQVAKESVKRLRDLKPSLAIPSHGKPLSGKELAEHLEMLVANFETDAKPNRGRFVGDIK